MSDYTVTLYTLTVDERVVTKTMPITTNPIDIIMGKNFFILHSPLDKF